MIEEQKGFQVHSGPVLEELRGMSETELEQTRELAKYNLWFLLCGVLGYDQPQEDLHGPLCNFLVYEQSTRRMVLMPRGFLKSTVCTIANPIRLALQDPAGYRACIENENETKAASFLDEIKNHWMYNEALRTLFPTLVPVKFAGPGSDWSTLQASLNAPRITRQSTWTCLGAGASGTSYHFNHIIPDDLIGEKQKMSAAEMFRITQWNKSNDQLLDNPGKDRIDWVGTRKTVDDTYNDITERESSLVTFLTEPFNDDPDYVCGWCATKHGRSAFHTKISTEYLCEKREKDPSEWAHDYMNNPVGTGGLDWSKSILLYQNFGFNEAGTRVMYYDPATKTPRSWAISELDRVITVDPNKGETLAPDRAAIVVHGVSPLGEVFILEPYSGRPNPIEFVDMIWDCTQKWTPRVVGIEEAGQQNTKFFFETKCNQSRGHYPDIVDLKHKNQEKTVRIRQRLDPYLRRRKMFFLQTSWRLRGQIEKHPQLGVHNFDEIDCTSYGPAIYQLGITDSQIEMQDDIEKKIMLARGRTGYGQSFRRPQTAGVSLQSRSGKERYEMIFGKGKR